MIHSFFHLGLHFLVPFWVAWAFFKGHWRKAWLVMMLTMIIDLDHLSNTTWGFETTSIGFNNLSAFIAVVKKTFRYSDVFFYNHLYHPERYYEKRYK